MSKFDNNKLITWTDKIYQFFILYFKWAYKNKIKVVKKSKLLDYWHENCKIINWVVFRFTLYEKKINVILCWFYK